MSKANSMRLFPLLLTEIFHAPDAGCGHPAYNDDGLVPVGRVPSLGALLGFQSRREICGLIALLLAFSGSLAAQNLPANGVDSKLKPGDESHYAGKADFYTLRFGPYLIGMNTTRTKTFEIKAPEGVKSAKE